MSERLQGHRTKLNANKMTYDGKCLSRLKQPVFSSFARTVQSSGVAWTWAAMLTPWRNLADCSTLAPRPRERHGRWQWTAAMEEWRERVLTPSGAPPRTEVGGTPEVVGEVRWRNAMETAVNEKSELVLRCSTFSQCSSCSSNVMESYFCN